MIDLFKGSDVGIGYDPTAQAQEQTQQEEDEPINFMGAPLIPSEEYEAEEQDDPRDQHIALLQAQNDKFAALLERFGNPAPAPAPVAEAPPDFYAGYDPTDYFQQFTEEPNTAIAQAPVMRQMISVIANLETKLKSMQSRLDETDFYERQKITDLDERAELKRVATDLPDNIIADAHKYRTQQRQAAAKAAEGMNRKSVRGQVPMADKLKVAQRRASGPTADNFFANLAARQQRQG